MIQGIVHSALYAITLLAFLLIITFIVYIVKKVLDKKAKRGKKQ